MAELVRGPNGEFGRYSPQTGLEVISEEEFRQLEAGRLERAAGAAADALQDVAGGALDVIEAPFRSAANLGRVALGEDPERVLQEGTTYGTRMMQANDPRQAARWSVDPAMSAAGGGAVLAAELAFPAGRAGRGMREIPTQQSIIAERMARPSAVNPNMSGPAQRIVASAESVVEANRVKMARADMLKAGGASGAQDLAAGSRLRRQAENMIFPGADPKVERVALADELGIPLSPGMRRGNEAQQAMEEGMSRNPGALEVWNREIKEPTQDKVTEIVREAFGLDPGTKFTLDDFTKGSDALSAEFDAIAESIPGSFLVTPDDVKQLKSQIAGATRNKKAQESVYRSWIRPFEESEGGGMDDVLFNQTRMNARDMWGMIRELNGAIVEAGSDAERQALTKIRDQWDEWFQGMAGSSSGEVQERIKNANEKFRVQKVLEKRGVMKGDEINYRALSNQAKSVFGRELQRNDYENARGQLLELPTRRFIKALQVVDAFPAVLGNSGTPTGSMLTGGLAGGAQKMIANRAGAEMYFGRALRSGQAIGRSAVEAASFGAFGR